jgi:FLYWCH zinc finger domain
MDLTCVVPANSRGGRVLIRNGYRYMRKSTSNTHIRWICTVTGCGAFVYTHFFDVHDNGDPNIEGEQKSYVYLFPTNEVYGRGC